MNKPMTVGELKIKLSQFPDDMEILTINPEKSLVFSRIVKVFLSETRFSDKWVTLLLKET